MRILALVGMFFIGIAGFSQKSPDASAVRDTYTFTYAYNLEVEVNGQKLAVTYYINPGADYFGYSMPLIPIAFEVNDVGRSIVFRTLGKKAKLSPLEGHGKKGPTTNKHQYTKLRDSTILGYRCIGLKAESDTEVATFYFTNEAEASYPELYKKLRVHHFVLAMAGYGFTEKSLLMRSEVIRKKDKGHAVITCTGFEKLPKTIRKSDYKIVDNF